MTVTGPQTTVEPPEPGGRRIGGKPRRRNATLLKVLIGVGILVVLLSVTAAITGAHDLTSPGTIGAALALSMPIAMAGLGGLWSERAGVVNIGLEGMMILGTWGAGWAGYQWGPWTGVLVGAAMGAAGGLLHAIATVGFGVDHIVSGVAINLLGLGAAQFLSGVAFEGVPGAGGTQSPNVEDITTVSVPFIGDPLRDLRTEDVFLVSDVAGILHGLFVDISLLTIGCILLVIGSYYVLWRSAFGLRLRSCGENPVAAESLGVNVYLMKYIAVFASGAFAGLGGAFLAIVAASGYREGQTGGRGFIGLAAMIFGNWRPGGLIMGSGLFGFTDALQLRGGESVHALLLLIGGVLLAAAVYLVVRKKLIGAAIAGVIGALALWWYFATDEIAGAFTNMTPYVATLIVLTVASQRLRMPAADGLPYRKGQGG
jgi:general nucleoside transport system permease protein